MQFIHLAHKRLLRDYQAHNGVDPVAHPHGTHNPREDLLFNNHQGCAFMALYCSPPDQVPGYDLRRWRWRWRSPRLRYSSPLLPWAGRGQPSSRRRCPRVLPPARTLISQLRPPEISRQRSGPGTVRVSAGWVGRAHQLSRAPAGRAASAFSAGGSALAHLFQI